jgi:lipopolysaccharide export system permease protein
MRRHLLDRLLTMEMIGPFFQGVGLFTTILVAMEELQPLTSMVVEHGVPFLTAARIFLLSLPYFMALAFPMGMLLATLLAFGQLSSDSEIIALQAAGVSLYRMAVPVALLGVLVSLMAITFDELVSPLATAEKNRIYDQALSAGAPSNRPFHYEQMQNGLRLFTLDADNYDSETKKLLRPTLTFYQDGRPAAIEFAERGRWQGGFNWIFTTGFVQKISDNPLSYSPVITFQGDQPTRIGVSLAQLAIASEDANALTYSQLKRRIVQKVAERRSDADIDADRVVLYSKVSIPFASLVFALIGFPLGIRRQRTGGAMGYAFAIAIIFVYYLIYQYSTILGNNGAVPPLMSAWVPDILGFVAGIALLRISSN